MTEGGEVVFQDDASIEAGDPIWRRVSPGQWTFNHNKGQIQPKSGLFQYNKHPETRQKHPMSVALGKGITPDAAIAGKQAGTKLVLGGQRNTFARWRSGSVGTIWRMRSITALFLHQKKTTGEIRKPLSPVWFKLNKKHRNPPGSRCKRRECIAPLRSMTPTSFEARRLPPAYPAQPC